MKTCSGCEQELDDQNFPFVGKDRVNRRGQCRSCYAKSRRAQRFADWKPACSRCKNSLGDIPRRMGRQLCKACDVAYDSSIPKRKNGSRRLTMLPCSLCLGPKGRGQRARLCAACKPWASYARSLRLYGLKPQDYIDLLEAQGGRCAICREKPGKKRLSVDHDHDGVGKDSVRGLLCSTCNFVRLSVFNDDPSLLHAAADYLDRFRERAIS